MKDHLLTYQNNDFKDLIQALKHSNLDNEMNFISHCFSIPILIKKL